MSQLMICLSKMKLVTGILAASISTFEIKLFLTHLCFIHVKNINVSLETWTLEVHNSPLSKSWACYRQQALMQGVRRLSAAALWSISFNPLVQELLCITNNTLYFGVYSPTSSSPLQYCIVLLSIFFNPIHSELCTLYYCSAQKWRLKSMYTVYFWAYPSLWRSAQRVYTAWCTNSMQCVLCSSIRAPLRALGGLYCVVYFQAQAPLRPLHLSPLHTSSLLNQVHSAPPLLPRRPFFSFNYFSPSSLFLPFLQSLLLLSFLTSSPFPQYSSQNCFAWSFFPHKPSQYSSS